MNTTLTIIAVCAAAAAFIVSKRKQRRPSIWALLCFFSPSVLIYLIQIYPEEKILKPLLTRYGLALLVATLDYASLGSVKVESGYSSYEMFILENVDHILTVLNQEFYRDERVFETPRFAIEVSEGLILFYGSFFLSCFAIVQSIFLKPVRPSTSIVYGLLFAALGHILSVAGIATLVIVLDSPEQVTVTPHGFIRNIYFSLGIALAYVVVLGHAFIKTRNQSQKTLKTPDNARSTP